MNSLLQAIDYSLKYLDKADETAINWFGHHPFSNAYLRESLQDFKEKLLRYGLSQTFFDYIAANYYFFRSATEEVLFTGYYEAELKGSLTPSPTYSFPLYQKPRDLYQIELTQFPFYSQYPDLPRILRGRIAENNTIIPYYSREEIDYQGKLKGQGLELVWIDNPIDVFFLHIQGSGIVQLENGQTLRVNYAETNGHPYRAIGKLLIQQNAITPENMSMQSIRQYLESNPEEVKDIFSYNPSYIFFRQVDEGPIGALGVPVTPYRSIATDALLFPRSALGFIVTEQPVFDEQNHLREWQPYKGCVLNQDTGGAIRTPGRVDLFTGFGETSRLVAGHMKQKGTFYFLIKKPPADQDIQ